MTPAGRGRVRGLGQARRTRAPMQLGPVHGVVVRLSAKVAEVQVGLSSHPKSPIRQAGEW